MVKANRFDIAIFLLVASQCGGVLGGSLQLSRIVSIILVPFLIQRLKGCRYVKDFFVCFTFFILYCFLSLFWTPDSVEGLKQLLYWIVHFLIFIEIIVFARYANRPFNSIAWGWIFAVFFCSIISIWEISTLNHLETAKDRGDQQINAGEEGIVTRFFTMATFYNPNGYVAFLCFSFPWLFYQLEDSISLKKKMACFFTIVFATIDILCNASRGGLITLFILVGIYILMTKKSIVKAITILIVVIPLAYTLIEYGDFLFTAILSRASDSGLTNGESRFVIWLSAWQAFLDTYGLGVGVGGMEAAMENYSHGGITVTHSLFFEILLQYGILFTFVFLLFLWKLIIRTLKIEQKNRKMASLMALISLPIYTIINSGYLGMPQLFVLFGTIYVFVYYERIKFSNRSLRKITSLRKGPLLGAITFSKGN